MTIIALVEDVKGLFLYAVEELVLRGYKERKSLITRH